MGKTVKEKVWMHTSRDIRCVAGQLVKLWIEVFRREKAQGMIKSVKKLSGSSPNSTLGSQKVKVKDPTVGTGKSMPVTHGEAKCRPSVQSASPSADSSAAQSKVVVATFFLWSQCTKSPTRVQIVRRVRRLPFNIIRRLFLSLKVFLFLQVLNGEELRSDDPISLATPSAEGVRGDTLSGEAERPLSDLEIVAIAAAEQAHAAAAAAAKVYFLSSGRFFWTGFEYLYRKVDPW